MPGSPSLPDLLTGPRSALVVATATYADPELTQLRSPAKDAADLARVLSDTSIGHFQVTSLMDRTASDVKVGVVEFLGGRKPEDLLVIYLSCHGLLDARGRLFFAATDTTKKHLAANGIESRWLFDQLDECRARRQVVILDCCFSGAFSAAGTRGEVDLEHLTRGRGRAVLTASRAGEYSFEGEILSDGSVQSAVFTAGLIEGLRTGAADISPRDGYISVEEAYEFAFNYVQDKGNRQTPQRWIFGGEDRIWLARNPKHVARAAQISAELLEVLSSPHAAVRLTAVVDLSRMFTSGDAAAALAAKRDLEKLVREDPSPVIVSAAKEVLAQVAPMLLSKPTLLLTGHRERVWSVAFHPSLEILASGGADRSVRLWNSTTGELVTELHEQQWIHGVDFHPSGSLLATGGDLGVVQLWDTATWESLHRLEQHIGGVEVVRFSRDGEVLASAGKDALVRLWDPHAGKLLTEITGSRSPVIDLAFGPQGDLLVMACADGSIRLWDWRSGRVPSEIPHQQGPVNSVAFNRNGALMASGHEDGRVLLWDVASGQITGVLEDHRKAVYRVVFSPQGDLLASAGEDGSIRLWNPDSKQLLRALPDHAGWIRGLAFHPAGNRLASAGRDKTVRLWDFGGSSPG